MLRLLIFLVTLSVRALSATFRTREELLTENLALRQQVAALKKERPRLVLDDFDGAFWVALRTAWAGWASRWLIVNRIRSPSGIETHSEVTARSDHNETIAQDGLEAIRRFDALFA